MKVEKYGKVPPKEPEQSALAWWVGKRAECKQCGTIVTLTAVDGPPNMDSFNLRCPNPGCGGYIYIRPIYDRTGRIC